MVKRKLSSSEASPSKRKRVAYDALSWKKLDKRGLGGGGDAEGMMLDLEELDDVDIVYEEVDGRRVPTFVVKEAKAPKAAKTQGKQPVSAIPSTFDNVVSMDAWDKFGLHPALVYALSVKKYATPTPIQEASLPKVVGASGLDLIGIAQTGSGKTFAYALPILDDLLRHPPAGNVKALVLVPTRELALQVKAAFDACLVGVHEKGKVPVVSVGTLVGGMAMQKQERILQRGVQVIVGTPGRVWDFMQTEDTLMDNVAWLVLDEADRLVQKGSFAEVDSILARIGSPTTDDDCGERTGTTMNRMIFSASMDPNALKRRKRRVEDDPNMLSALLDRLPAFKPDIVDVSTDAAPVKSGLSTLPPGLSSYLLPCLATQKDALLYYFLLRYPMRTLIFLPSIAHIRRLLPLLTTLFCSPCTPAAHRIPVHPLHSSLPQPTRLSSLQLFRENDKCVLLATDVAARGLDVDDVACVIHYCPAETPAGYLHRCGRTARKGKRGVSLTLCEPAQVRAADTAWKVFGEPARWEWDAAGGGLDSKVTEAVKKRVELARELEGFLHRGKKENADKKWMREAAETLGVDFDDEQSDGDEEEAKQRRKVDALKNRLTELLKKPLVPRGVSMRYLSSDMAQDLLDGNTREGLVGVRKAGLTDKTDLEDEEEWGGIV